MKATPQSTTIGILLAAIVAALAGFLQPVLVILLLVFAGGLFGIFLSGVCRWLSDKTGFSYAVCFLTMVIAGLSTSATGAYSLGVRAIQSVDQLREQLGAAISSAQSRLAQNDWASDRLSKMTPSDGGGVEMLTSLVPGMFEGLQWISWGVTGGFVIFFVGLYASYEPDLYRDGFLRLFPTSKQDNASELLGAIVRSLEKWIVGRLISMSIVGATTAMVMWFLGISLPVTVGLIAAALTFIPNVGPLIAAIPQVLLALQVGSQTVVYVIVFNGLLQVIESYLISPMIQRKEVSLPPILTITAQMLMGVVAGMIGVMVAAPLVVVGMQCVRHIDRGRPSERS